MMISATKSMFPVMIMLTVISAHPLDTNNVFDPCSDTKVQKQDGFTIGLAFSSKDAFFSNQIQLSPCDSRLHLHETASRLAVFRPKVDELTFLTVNTSDLYPANLGVYMVAFAGRLYAARSMPVFVADKSNVITSFTLVIKTIST
ncbi:hypothetical protein QVD17_19158 [Tagetes erecta]|uniref:Uncharacterized protein n=1 Tax=Tagetes erecta TaxID=13708 RepID=A0AAD8KJE6_TARER|nr:hypothetical protein QVD17_19158 [Tagetes erecta]